MRRFAALTLFIAFGLAAAMPAPSADKLVLTLDDCLRLAMEKNPFYLASKERESGAKAGVWNAASRFLPSINGQGTDILAKKVFTIEFPSMIPGEPPQRVKIDFTKKYQFTLAFSQPLFAGGGILAGFKQADLNLKATREGIRQVRHDTVLNVKRAFYGCLLAREFAKVSEEAVALAEKHAREVRNLHEVGMASKFDLLRSEVQLANLKPQLIRAKNNLDVADLALKNTLGLDLDQPVEIKGDFEYMPLEVDVEGAVIKALKLRPEINQLDFQTGMARQAVKMARASGLPTLALGAAYNFWGNQFTLRTKPWEDYYTVSLNLTFPIFNGLSTHAQVRQSKAAVREMELNMKGLAESIKLEVRQAVLNYKQARESLASQEKNVEEASEAARIAELNYSEGLATSLDVSTAQVALSQAKTNRSQALFDCVISLAQLEKAVGESKTPGETE